ncbi:MAG TPA: ABC transporter permease [Vicinamibacterales bacterium]|jgi:putative ABC transport system permease protein
MSPVSIALRTLLKARRFTTGVVLILAVGIGAATTMFSVVEGVILRPLPYQSPNRLVLAWDSKAPYRYTAPADFLDWRRMATSFDGLAAFAPAGVTRSGSGLPQRLQSLAVSANFFTLLGVQAALGRTFLPSDARAGAPREALLSDAAWRQWFDADSSAVGRTITLDDQPYTIVGIMPAGFAFEGPADLWTLAPHDIPGAFPSQDITAVRDARFFYVLGRLNPGVTLAQAGAELRAISNQLALAYPATNAGQVANIIPLRTAQTGDVRPALLVLFGAVIFLLLVACANVANLLLVRAADRRREIAIRLALGAGTGDLVRQFLTESLMLAGAGVGGGLFLCAWSIDAVKALAPVGTPRLADVRVDLAVLAFSVAAGLVTGLLFGLAPAVHLRSASADGLSHGSTRLTDSRRARRLRDLLAGGELAIAEILLVGAGLLIASFVHLNTVNPGFSSKDLLTFSLSLPHARYADPGQRTRFYDDLVDRLQKLPGVTHVGAVLSLPVAGGTVDRGLWIEGRPSSAPNRGYHVDFQLVSGEYFQTMAIPRVAGRTFDHRDVRSAPAVAVINAAMAHQYWPGSSPLGRRVGLGDPSSPDYWRTIVGIVGDVRQSSLEEAPAPQVYVPDAQNLEPWSSMTFALRTAGSPAALVNAVRSQVSAIDPEQPITRIQTMTEALRASTSRQSFNTSLLGLFAVIALLLAGVGVYAVRSYAVACRTRELGIRTALGADARDLVRLLARQGLSTTAAGAAVGLLGAIAVGRALRGLLFGVTATDPITLAAATAVLILVSLVACWLPARRATRIDPVVALRNE